jgi:hypothetical protein
MKGGRRDHIVPFPPILRELLGELDRFAATDFVFTGDGRRAVTGSSRLKERLDAALAKAGVQIDPFTFHDFRRTVTGWLASHGVDSMVADKLLAHTNTAKLSQVGMIYNRHDFLASRRAALEAWTTYLDEGNTESRSAPAEPPTLQAPAKRLALAAPKAGAESEPSSDLAILRFDDPNKVVWDALKSAKLFYDLVVTVQNDPEVIRANYGLLRHKLTKEFEDGCSMQPLAPGAIAVNPYSVAFLRAAELRVQILLYPRPFLKESAAKPVLDGWGDHAKGRRLAVEAIRAQARAARAAAEQARALAQEDHAVEADAEAQALDAKAEREEANAKAWDDMLAMAHSDWRLVKNLAPGNPLIQGRNSQERMADYFRKVFDGRGDNVGEEAAVAYTNVFQDPPVTMAMGRRNRLKKRAAYNDEPLEAKNLNDISVGQTSNLNADADRTQGRPDSGSRSCYTRRHELCANPAEPSARPRRRPVRQGAD